MTMTMFTNVQCEFSKPGNPGFYRNPLKFSQETSQNKLILNRNKTENFIKSPELCFLTLIQVYIQH